MESVGVQASVLSGDLLHWHKAPKPWDRSSQGPDCRGMNLLVLGLTDRYIRLW